MTDAPAEFFAHQRRALSWLRKHPRGILALQQGLGKTAVAIVDAEYPAAVVPPAHGNTTWRNEWQHWAPERHVQIVRPGDSFELDADVWVINYDIIGRTALPRSTRTLIGDESHYLANAETPRARAFARFAKHVPRLRLLSGTPMQRPIDLWTQLRMVGGTRLPRVDFGKWYCGGFLDEFGRWDFRGASHQDELRGVLARAMFRVTKDEALPDMPPKVWKVVPLDLPVGNERDYDLDAIARTGSPTPFEGLSELLRLQAELKLPYVIRYIEDALQSEEKIVVFAWHREMVRALAQHFASVGVVTYNSETPQRAKDAAQEVFQGRGGARLFIGNIVSAGTVLTLTAASLVVFAEGSWNPNQLDQAADRCHRIGQTRPVRVRILTIDNSIDHQMVRRCLEKLRVINNVVVPTVETGEEIVSTNTNPSIIMAESFEKLSQALIAQAAVLSHFAEQYRASTSEPAAAAAPSKAKAPTTDKKAAATPKDTSAGAVSGTSLKEAQDHAVSWIKEGADKPAQMAINAKIKEILAKHGGEKLDQLTIAALQKAHAEIVAARAAGAASASSDEFEV